DVFPFVKPLNLADDAHVSACTWQPSKPKGEIMPNLRERLKGLLAHLTFGRSVNMGFTQADASRELEQYASDVAAVRTKVTLFPDGIASADVFLKQADV